MFIIAVNDVMVKFSFCFNFFLPVNIQNLCNLLFKITNNCSGFILEGPYIRFYTVHISVKENIKSLNGIQ